MSPGLMSKTGVALGMSESWEEVGVTGNDPLAAVRATAILELVWILNCTWRGILYRTNSRTYVG